MDNFYLTLYFLDNFFLILSYTLSFLLMYKSKNMILSLVKNEFNSILLYFYNLIKENGYFILSS